MQKYFNCVIIKYTSYNQGDNMDYEEIYNNCITISTYLKDKTTNLNILDISGKSELCKFMVFCSVSSEDINKQLCTELSIFLKENNIDYYSIDGQIKGEWIVFDLQNIIIHIFSKDLQTKYNLEKLWKDNKTKVINI